MTGLEVAERVHASIPGVKIMFASGYMNDVAGLRTVLEQGGTYLQKPFTAESLAQKVREALDANSNASPRSASPTTGMLAKVPGQRR
jgi:CheY-like chemotaxis protein